MGLSSAEHAALAPTKPKKVTMPTAMKRSTTGGQTSSLTFEIGNYQFLSDMTV